MKKIFLTLIGVVLLAPSLKGQTTKDVSLVFNTSDFQIQENDNHLYILSDTLYLYYGNDTSEPALPYVRVNVLIPPDKEYSNFSFTYSRQLVSTQIPVASNSELVPLSNVSKNQLQNTLIPMKFCYPDSNVVYDGTTYYSYYKIISFKVFPFKFFQLGQNLYLYTNISLCITLDDTEDIRYPSYYIIESRQEEIKNNVMATVINGNELEAMYANISYPSFVPPTPYDNTDYNYDYLIVAPKYFMFNGFDRLAQWKTTKGVKTKVLLLDSINAKYSGSTLQTRIKKAIKDYYVKSAGRLEYVLLAADVDKIPTLMCYGEVVTSGDTIREHIPTDYYYSCLEDINWDKNGNGIYGEVTDSVNLNPDVSVTRIPLKREDMSDYIERLLSYEISPDTANWQNKMLLCANIGSGYYTVNGSQISDSHFKIERLYNGYIRDYWNGQTWRLYDTYSDFPGGSEYDFDTYNLGSQLGYGYQILYHKGHGDETGWCMENNGYFSTDHITHSNQLLPLIITDACSTNAFDYSEPCLGESFIKNKALAYVGCSRTNWFRPDTFIVDPCSQFSRSIFYNLLEKQIITLGKIQRNVKEGLCMDVKKYGALRWIVFGINFLGDAELPFYTVKPKDFDDVSIYYDGSSLHVSTNTDNCRICLTSQNDFGGSYFRVVKDTCSALFTDLIGSYTVCITKDGYLPYVIPFNVNTYIQNENITENRTITSYNTYIGSNVTYDKPIGPVFINNGKTSIWNKNEVTITRDFEVRQGAEFEIITQ